MSSCYIAVALQLVLISRIASAVRLHEVQLLGTHNSYHIAPDPELDEVREIDERLGELVDANQYTHPPLSEQLTDFNVRSIELDVYDDREGGKFSFRAARALLGLDGVWDESPEMQEPGFKVMHIDNVDYETHCKTLTGCLADIKQWSDSNPTHIPLLLRVELKRETVIETLEREDPAAAAIVLERLLELQPSNPQYETDFQRTSPPTTTETAALLLDTVVQALGRDKLIVPDDLRGDAEYPRQALTERGPDAFWPEIDAVRGKIILIVTGLGPELIELYGSGLVGSPAFTRFLADAAAGADIPEIPGDVVFVEHYGAGSSRYLSRFIEEGFFVFAFADLAESAGSDSWTSYQEVVAAGPQVILTERLQRTALQIGYFARLPCEEGEAYCVLPTNSTYVPRDEQVELPVVPTRVEARDAILLREGASAAAALVSGFAAAAVAAVAAVLW
eukprot:jgi/Ulvmu1/3004/UM015_0044.1